MMTSLSFSMLSYHLCENDAFQISKTFSKGIFKEFSKLKKNMSGMKVVWK